MQFFCTLKPVLSWKQHTYNKAIFFYSVPVRVSLATISLNFAEKIEHV